MKESFRANQPRSTCPGRGLFNCPMKIYKLVVLLLWTLDFVIQAPQFLFWHFWPPKKKNRILVAYGFNGNPGVGCRLSNTREAQMGGPCKPQELQVTGAIGHWPFDQIRYLAPGAKLLGNVMYRLASTTHCQHNLTHNQRSGLNPASSWKGIHKDSIY